MIIGQCFKMLPICFVLLCQSAQMHSNRLSSRSTLKCQPCETILKLLHGTLCFYKLLSNVENVLRYVFTVHGV